MIAVYGKLPGQSEVLLDKVEKAGDAKRVKDEWGEVFKAEGITTRVEIIKDVK